MNKTLKVLKMSSTTWKPRYFDIGVNFSDAMFHGYYHGSATRRHPSDIDQIVARAKLFNVNKMMITASTIKESQDHLSLCEQYPQTFISTAGIHPCSVAQEFYSRDPENETYTETLIPELDQKLAQLKNIIEEGHSKGYIKAFGEIGLDYDRLHYSSKNQQLTMFKKQLELYATLKSLDLSLFLHMRSACDDFISVIKPFVDNGTVTKGVVHSFTGTNDELTKLLDLGFFVSVNGCSLKTQDNLDVAALIPLDKLIIETDAPWCEIRKSHASYKYVTEYPNKFYPEIEMPESTRDEINETIKASKVNSKKPAAIKFDEMLPFPSIKKENFDKHASIVQKLSENHPDPESLDFSIGTFAYPLIKTRNEPVFIGQVAEIMCGVRGYRTEQEIEHFIDTVYNNSCSLFGN